MARFPRLRKDLLLQSQTTPSGRVVIAKDPLTGRFFRLREVEAFIAERLDGRTSPEAIRTQAEQHFGGALSGEALTRFLATLSREALLHGSRPAGRARQRRLRGSLFYLRYPLFDPDRMLARWAPWAEWMYSRSFLAAAILLLAAAIVVLVSHWPVLTFEAAALYKVQTIPGLVLTAFAIITAHELAHGMTCKRYGGEVREIGLILIYFQPAMYCNVSDAWLFPQKSKRLLVGLAGPGFELFLWSVATVLWHFSESDTALHHATLMVMAISGVKTLINFNPLIKLDGYYLLSDLLEIPNLRRKSFRYVGDGLRSFFLGGPRREELPSPRERRIFATYGAISTLASLAFAGFALVVTGSYLLDSHRPLGLLAFAGLFGLVTQRRARRLFGSSDVDPDESAESPAEPVAKSGGTGPVRPGSRRRWLAIALAAAALVLAFLVEIELRIGGAFEVVPLGKTEIRSTVEGVVEAVLVGEGSVVTAGQAVARLAGREVEARIGALEAQVRETQAQLELLQAGPQREEIEVARLAAASAADRLDYARRRHAMDAQLFGSGLVSRKAFDESEAAVAQAESDVAAADARHQQLRRGSRPEELDAMRARLDRLRTDLGFVASERERLEIPSTVNGVVATANRELAALPGRLVAKGGLVAEVYDPASLVAMIVIAEKEIADVSVGQRVVLRARAFPGEAFEGTVRSIAVVASQSGVGAVAGPSVATSGAQPGSRMFLVTASIENREHRLQPEMSGQAKILCGQRTLASLIARRLVRTFKIEVWSWW